MSEFSELKKQANHYRKNKAFNEALPLYRELWEKSGDQFDAAGLLQCLRQLKKFDEAIPLAKEFEKRFSNFNWCRMEIIWTYIQGVLNNPSRNVNFETEVKIAKHIMKLNPDGLSLKLVVFKVLKSAKAAGKWNLIDEWVVKIIPENLNDMPIASQNSRVGWSDQAIWYNYRVRSLIELHKEDEAIAIVDEIVSKFPKELKFFQRLKGFALAKRSQFEDAEKVYKTLCNNKWVDWWLLYEYANVIKALNRKEEALKMMYNAAIGKGKTELKVSLFAEIGMLCKELEYKENAIMHLLLSKYIREDNDWSVNENVINAINSLKETLSNDDLPSNIKDSLNLCRQIWYKNTDINKKALKPSLKKRNPRTGIVGKVSLGYSTRSFCFINSDKNESFFCMKSDLPADIEDGTQVIFDAVPSFDRKKNKDSWKAINVKTSSSRQVSK